jgi:hypothetical protein
MCFIVKVQNNNCTMEQNNYLSIFKSQTCNKVTSEYWSVDLLETNLFINSL